MKKYYIFIFLIILSFNASQSQAKHLYKEKEYQEYWCIAHGGAQEYVLDDKTRIDCLTDTHAIEFDFANKWYECVGQSLYYSLQTGKQAGAVLIMEKPIDKFYLIRMKKLAKKYNITVWTITPNELIKNHEIKSRFFNVLFYLEEIDSKDMYNA